MRKIGDLIYSALILLCGVIICATSSYAQDMIAPDQANHNDANKDAYPDSLALTDMFIAVSVPSHRVYINEMLRVEYNIYIAISRGQINYDFHEPDFEKWYVFETTPPKDSFVTINNKKYRKEPFAVYYISAFNAGSLKLPPLEVTVPFETPPVWISSEPHPIEILMPQPPYPADFDLHNIGDFSLDVQKPIQTTFQTGQLIEFEFVISGNAPTFNVLNTSLYPQKLNDLYGNELKIYPLKPQNFYEDIKDGKYYSEMHYKANVIALTPGTYSFPPLSLMTFSPTTQRYELIQTKGFSVSVEDNGYVYNPPTLSSQLEFETLDPVQINLIKDSHIPRLPWPVFCLPLLIFATFFGSNVMRKFNEKRRQEQKLELHKEELFQKLAQSLSSSDQLSLLKELLSILLASDAEPNIRLNIQALCDAGLSTSDALSLSNIYDTLSRANYSNQAPLSPVQTQEAVRILRQLQKSE